MASAGWGFELERRLRQVVLVGALAVIVYLGLAVLSDASAIQDGLQRLGPWQWLALLGLSLINDALRFLRWHAYLQALDARVPIGRDLLIDVAGFAFTVTPGKAGEAVRSRRGRQGQVFYFAFIRGLDPGIPGGMTAQ